MNLPSIDRRSELEKEMDMIVQYMSNLDPSTEDYKNAAEAYKILSEAKKNNAADKVSKNAILSAVVSTVQFGVGMLFSAGGVVIWNHVRDTWHKTRYREED